MDVKHSSLFWCMIHDSEKNIFNNGSGSQCYKTFLNKSKNKLEHLLLASRKPFPPKSNIGLS
jgi:hypothetical protein